MVLNTKTGELTEGSYFRKTYWLTPTQTKILTFLADNEIHKIKELADKVQISEQNIRVMLSRIRKRVKSLNLKTIRCFGIILEDKINITY